MTDETDMTEGNDNLLLILRDITERIDTVLDHRDLARWIAETSESDAWGSTIDELRSAQRLFHHLRLARRLAVREEAGTRL